jgi:hypothetical protein
MIVWTYGLLKDLWIAEYTDTATTFLIASIWQVDASTLQNRLQEPKWLRS